MGYQVGRVFPPGQLPKSIPEDMRASALGQQDTADDRVSLQYQQAVAMIRSGLLGDVDTNSWHMSLSGHVGAKQLGQPGYTGDSSVVNVAQYHEGG